MRFQTELPYRICLISILSSMVVVPCLAQLPSITPGGVVPLYSRATTIQPGEWVSIYGTNLATGTATWNGDFPTILGGTSVKVNGKPAYLSYVNPGQINMQAPDDTATGTVTVVVTTPNGSTASTVTLDQYGPSISLLDGRHVAGIILRSDRSGAYGGGSYDIIGPTGQTLGYPTVAAKPGDSIALFGVGFGATTPVVPAGKPFSGQAPTNNPVTVFINGLSVPTTFTGMSGTGVYQMNLVVPAGLGTGDIPLQAVVGGVQSPAGVVITLDKAPIYPEVSMLSLSANAISSGGAVTGTVTLSAPAPNGGAQVSLVASSGTITIPAAVSVPAGALTATFSITAGTVSATETITVTALYGGASAQATLTAKPPVSATFTDLDLITTWNVPGNAGIGMNWTLRPDGTAVSFTASGTPAFTGCTATKSNTVFVCNTLSTVSQGSNTIFNPAYLNVTSASLTFTLTQNVAAYPYTGTLTGSLTVTGTPAAGGGASQTFTGQISGNYIVVP